MINRYSGLVGNTSFYPSTKNNYYFRVVNILTESTDFKNNARETTYCLPLLREYEENDIFVARVIIVH